MCSHVTLIAVLHPFHILRELPCCFYSKTVSFYFLNRTNRETNSQMNSTANRYDSVKITGWKVPLIYFLIIDGIEILRSLML